MRLFLLVFVAGIQVAFACLGVRLEGVFERFGLLESLEEDHLNGHSVSEAMEKVGLPVNS